MARRPSAADAGVEQLRTTLGTPELSLSRLLCPRLLTPNTDYIACVVPTFELGRKAGLGLEITESELTNPSGLKPAWPPAPPSTTVTLPVYHHWRFRTGEGGDFESLVRLLRPRPVPSGLGKRPIDISQPGFPVPGIPRGTTLELEGALRPIDAGPSTPAAGARGVSNRAGQDRQRARHRGGDRPEGRSAARAALVRPLARSAHDGDARRRDHGSTRSISIRGIAAWRRSARGSFRNIRKR